ncbi:hypothetical protein OAH18_01215 [bacterium]|nr:hypothetical protein [bacterium]
MGRYLGNLRVAHRMDNPPTRTGTTFLTDDDLLIYDFLTLGWTHISLVRQVDYGFHMNCGYAHSLADADLLDRIHDLAQLRLLAYRHARRRRRVKPPPKGQLPFTFAFPPAIISFNADGADIWEQERCPDWDRYVSFRHSEPDEIIVASPSKSAIADCLKLGHAANRFQLTSTSIKFAFHTTFSLTYWRPFDNIYTVKASCIHRPPGTARVDWNLHELNRSWWEKINRQPAR